MSVITKRQSQNGSIIDKMNVTGMTLPKNINSAPDEPVFMDSLGMPKRDCSELMTNESLLGGVQENTLVVAPLLSPDKSPVDTNMKPTGAISRMVSSEYLESIS